MKVSFDYDGTITRPSVYKYISKLISKGIIVDITTSRGSSTDNKDIYKLRNELGIRCINFTNGFDKVDCIKNLGYLFHVDDSRIELGLLTETNIVPICVFNNPNWEDECNKVIENYGKNKNN